MEQASIRASAATGEEEAGKMGLVVVDAEEKLLSEDRPGLRVRPHRHSLFQGVLAMFF